MKIYLFLITLMIQNLFCEPLNIKVSYEDKQTYPFTIGTGTIIDKEKPGVTIEVLRTLEKKLNVKFYFKREQGIRGQKSLKTNKTDMLLFASYKKEREEMGVYPKNSNNKIDTRLKAMDLSYVLYTLKDSGLSWDGEKFINLKGKIGATKGYSIIPFLKEKGVTVSENTSNLGDPRKLIAKRIQGFANQESKIDPYLRQHPSYGAKIKKISPPLKTKPYYILFSHSFYKKYPKLAKKIWKLTADHMNNPGYLPIIKKYE